MNALAPASPAIGGEIAHDLLTGMEWPAATVRELLHLAAEVKAAPDRYRTALVGKYRGDDF